MRVVLQYFAVFIALFGPKLGVLDSRLLLIPILLIFHRFENLKFHRDYIILLAINFFLLIYSFNQFLFFPPNPEFLRYTRALISLFCLPFIIGYKNSFESALSILVNVLILHPISIFISMFFPSVQYFLAIVFQFVAESRDLRYNGLTAGFDIAGYLSISGFLILLFKYYHDKRTITFIKAFIFLASIFFTSRTSIIVLIFLSILLFFSFISKYKFSFKRIFLGFAFFAVFSFMIYKYVLPNFISTINIEIFQELSDVGNEEAVLTYARTDPFQMLIDFIILPKSTLGLIFGENYSPLSDSGYIQAINAVGFFGLFISFFFYFKVYSGLDSIMFDNQLKNIVSKGLKIIIFITLLLCVKNQYLFTRGTFELIVLLFFSLKLPNRDVV